MKIIDSIWFTGIGMLGCVGIVLGEDEVTGKRKAYVGNAPGTDQDSDEQRIVATGGKLTSEMAEKISKFMNGDQQ